MYGKVQEGVCTLEKQPENEEKIKEDTAEEEAVPEMKKSDNIALCRFEVRSTPEDIPCAAQIILRNGEEMSQLISVSENGMSRTAAVYMSEESEKWSVSVYSNGYYSVKEAQIELRAGEMLEVPVRLEKMPDGTQIFKRTAEI